MITKNIFDRIIRKNGRARKKMARRYLKKALKMNQRILGLDGAQNKQYDPLEFELANHVIRGWSAKTKRTQAKRRKNIEKSVLSNFAPKIQALFS